MVRIKNEELINLNLSFNKLLTWFLDDRSCCLELDGDHRSLEIASHLSANFKLLSSSKIEQQKITEYQPDKFSLKSYQYLKDEKYIMKINDIYEFVNNYLGKYITNFIIHGSLATFDFSKGWSDVDTFVVLKNSTLLSPKKLYEFRALCLKLKKIFYKLCPLQHHGLIVFSEDDLNNYSSFFIPHQILNSSIEFLNSAAKVKLKIKYDEEVSDELLTIKRLESLKKDLGKAIVSGKLCHHPYKRECLENNYKNAKNSMRQLFWLLGNIMTMPAYLLTAIGKPCEKKFSFKKAETLYSKDSLKFIESVSKIRTEWELLEGTSYKGNSIPSWIQNKLDGNYFERFFNLLEETLEIINQKNSCS